MVRKILAENGISETEVTGTGSGGRITRDDALRAVEARRSAAPPPASQAAPVAPPPPPVVPAAPAPPVARAAPAPAVSMASFRAAGDQMVPFSNMRRRTAEHMVRSKATSPHAFIANEVDFENVERVRKAWGERFKSEEGFALTYLPFVARAAVEALRDFPLLNASVVDDSLLVHAEVNLGIAVDLSHEGLIVPVIHRAEEVTLRGVARRIRDLAERARGRQLNADDIAGGTFSITNDGPFGTYFTVPIINQPQVAILDLEAVVKRPVVVSSTAATADAKQSSRGDEFDSIAIHPMSYLCMSWDHRALDGADAARFLGDVKARLEDWEGAQ
jgi:2-oxoglutarate dehydrogenase E2 component (dihydrolipoamide succinyltransferase)